MFASDEADVAVSISSLTYLLGMRNSRSAPQKARPKPMKDNMYEPLKAEAIKQTDPRISSADEVIPIVRAVVNFGHPRLVASVNSYTLPARAL